MNEISNEKPSKEPLVNQFDIQNLVRKELQKIVEGVAQQPSQPLPNPSQPLPKPSQPISIGTQINIQNLNIDLRNDQKSDLEEEEVQQCRIPEEKDDLGTSGLFLGTREDVLDYEKLSNIVQNFYGGQQDKIKNEQQKTLQQRKKNSPMLIKFFE